MSGGVLAVRLFQRQVRIPMWLLLRHMLDLLTGVVFVVFVEAVWGAVGWSARPVVDVVTCRLGVAEEVEETMEPCGDVAVVTMPRMLLMERLLPMERLLLMGSCR